MTEGSPTLLGTECRVNTGVGSQWEAGMTNDDVRSKHQSNNSCLCLTLCTPISGSTACCQISFLGFGAYGNILLPTVIW